MKLKAALVIRRNIDELLEKRKGTRKALAHWVGVRARGKGLSESWISHIYTDETRGISLKYFDLIADFLGCETFQLFQPGMAESSERRNGFDRRTGKERRVGLGLRFAQSLAAELDATRQPTRRPTHGLSVQRSPLQAQLQQQFAQTLRAIDRVFEADARRQTKEAEGRKPKTPPRHRNPGGPHAEKS